MTLLLQVRTSCSLLRPVNNSMSHYCFLQGLHFPDIICSGCYMEGVAGIHWQCAHCYKYNLCHSCYMMGRHCQEHPFFRVDSKVQAARYWECEWGHQSSLSLAHSVSLQGEDVLSCWCQESGDQGCICRSRGRARPTLEVWRSRRYICMYTRNPSIAVEDASEM